MEYQCGKCMKILCSAVYLKKHTEKECMCKVEHEHIIVAEKFNSLQEAEDFFIEKELDVTLSVCKTVARTRVNDRTQNVTLKYYVCRIAKRFDKNCPAIIKIVKSKDKFLVLGCLKHSHEIKVRDLKLSKQVHDSIRGMLKFGLTPRKIKQLYFSNEESGRRPVSMSDIFRIRRSVPETECIELGECEDTDTSQSDFEKITESLPEERDSKFSKTEVLSMLNKLRYAFNNPIEGHQLLQEVTPIFDKYSLPSASKVQKKYRSCGSHSKNSKLRKHLISEDTLTNLLKKGLTENCCHLVWQKIVSSDTDDVVSAISKYDGADRTILIRNFLSARSWYECYHCGKFQLQRIRKGFVSCDSCNFQSHVACIQDCKVMARSN